MLTNSEVFGSYLPVKKKLIQHTWQTYLQHASVKEKTQEGERLAKVFFLAKNDGSQMKEFRSTPMYISYRPKLENNVKSSTSKTIAKPF